MAEKLLEKNLREGIKKLGGLALKFWCISFTGIPDRLVLLPGGQVKWVELKSAGKPLSPRQKVVHVMLFQLGFQVWKIDDQADLNIFLKDCKQ